MSLYDSFMQGVNRVINNWGFLSTIPASRMDEIYLEEPQGFFQNIWAFIRLRTLSLVFIGLSLIDIVVDLLMTIRYAFGTLLLGEALQEERLASQKQYATGFGNRLYALLATVLTGGLIWLISPKTIIFYFTTGKVADTGVRAGGDYHHAADAQRVQPNNDVDELEKMIQEAIAEGRQIIPVGAGRSQGKQFLPDGNGKPPLVIDLQKFNTVNIDPDQKTASVGAGALWRKVQVAADENKLAVRVMQASNVFSVGGSLGTNIHGWDHKTGVFSNIVDSIEFINTQGKRQKIVMNEATSDEDKELFYHIAGGLGLYGVVYRVTFKLQDNEKLRREGEEVPVSEYVEYFKTKMQRDDVKMHYYRLDIDTDAPFQRGFTETYVSTGEKPLVTPHLTGEYPGGSRLQQVLLNLARRYKWVRRFYWNSELRSGVDTQPVATTNEVMQAPINAMFNPSVSETEWLQEYFLPGENLDDFLKDFAKIIKDNQVPLLNATVRFVKQHDKSPLSYAANGDRFAVVICFNQSLQPAKLIQAKKWLRQAQHLAVEKGGSYYLPYQHVSSPEDFKRSFPQAQKAQEYKERIDPKETFTSGFHQKYLATKPVKTAIKDPDYVRMVMNNPEWREAFKGFLEHVLMRVDAAHLYPLLDDILQYNDSHAEIYQELCARLPEIMPDPLSDVSHQLKSLNAIQTDLGQQAEQLIPQGKVINGILEFGSPARYVGGFKQHHEVKGKIYTATETTPSQVDRLINTGSFSPYDKNVLYSYSKPELKGIPDHSVDIVTCYVGLHHFSPENLDVFLTEVKRVLREGGQFLLVDHAVEEPHSLSMAMAQFAHFIFNAVNGVSLEEEMNEIRDFKPLSYWQEKLKEHGLDNVEINEGLIRPGDPTRNCMMTACNRQPQLQANLTDTETHQAEATKKDCKVKKWKRAKELNGHDQKKSVSTKQGLFKEEKTTPKDKPDVAVTPKPNAAR